MFQIYGKITNYTDEDGVTFSLDFSMPASQDYIDELKKKMGNTLEITRIKAYDGIR